MARKQREYESKAAYDMSYAKENLKRIPLDIPKEQYEKIKEHAAKHDKSVNGFIKRAIAETMKRDIAQNEKSSS
jgi:predicted HicB family RNase H-like nuclease